MSHRLFICLILFPLFLHAQQESLPAEKVVSNAVSAAAIQHKKVFLIFHASWCGWCHKMDSVMNQASLRKYFADNYVITHLDFMESDGKKSLENPGTKEVYKQYNPKEAGGIPFWVVLDRDGKLLADSFLSNGDNTGCPSEPKEIEHFIAVLKKTSGLNAGQLTDIQNTFARAFAPHH